MTPFRKYDSTWNKMFVGQPNSKYNEMEEEHTYDP